MTDEARTDEFPLAEDEPIDADLQDNEDLTLEALSDLVLYTLDWSVQSLLERVGTTFDVNPMFQRRDAWSRERKSLYIESLVVGLPVPQIVLAEDRDRRGHFIVLDGKQRLTTVKQFAAPDENYKSFKLKGLQFAHDLEGMTFDDMRNSLIGADLAESFLAQPIRTIVVRNWSNPAVLYQVFVRLNQGSLSLSPQELRQALYPNEFTRWVNERSARSEAIQRARGLKGPDFRMRDAEMLLRYLAFRADLEGYRGNLRAFLDDACVTGGADWRRSGSDPFETMAGQCEQAIERTFATFGERDAFRRFEDGAYNTRFNIAVFDAMTAVLGDEAVTNAALTEHASEIKAQFEQLCDSDPDFADSLQTTTKSIGATAKRIITLGEMVGSELDVDLGVVGRAKVLEASTSNN